MPTNTQVLEREHTTRQEAREQERTEALERLMRLLEQGGTTLEAPETFALTSDLEHWNRIARLRAAHARYVLRTSDRIERVGPGAFFLRRDRIPA